jgi:hypothetical protein
MRDATRRISHNRIDAQRRGKLFDRFNAEAHDEHPIVAVGKAVSGGHLPLYRDRTEGAGLGGPIEGDLFKNGNFVDQDRPSVIGEINQGVEIVQFSPNEFFSGAGFGSACLEIAISSPETIICFGVRDAEGREERVSQVVKAAEKIVPAVVREDGGVFDTKERLDLNEEIAAYGGIVA